VIIKARAVILIDGRLIVANQRRRGRSELSLPGGRVNRFESVLDAVKREVAGETGFEVIPHRLLYVSEVVQSVCSQTYGTDLGRQTPTNALLAHST
jgi:ADP-ribose pyrophosphatase YjhB (NUDIX family)